MKNIKILLALIIALSFSPTIKDASAQVDPYLGQIMYVGFTFCPRGWAEANGQQLQISSNSALFSLLGTTYGGDGRTVFNLPDLRGRVPLHAGQGPGLPNYNLGNKAGSTEETLTTNQIPSHSHNLTASGDRATVTDPSSNALAASGHYRGNKTNPSNLESTAIGNTGGSQPHNNMQPYLTIRACIALEGTYPSRS